MIKEMYLKDGDMHQDKDFRKKQFRWKTLGGKQRNLDFGTRRNIEIFAVVGDKGVNPFSSDDEEEDEEEDGDDDEAKKGNFNMKASKKFQNLNSNDWRKNRHEREEFFSRKVV